MTLRLAWWLIVAGLALILSGCVHPLGAAAASADTAARALTATHDELAERYRAEQLEAARAVEGDRSSPEVRAEQRARVEAVRRRWRPAWDAYALARASWAALTTVLDAALQAERAGGQGGVDALELARLVAALAEAQRQLVEAAEAMGGVR